MPYLCSNTPQALKYIVHEQATKSSLSSSLSELSPFQTTFTDICLLVQEVPEEGDENSTRALKSSINLHCFYSHRALLYSHSEYFKVMFTSQFIESSQIDKQKYVYDQLPFVMLTLVVVRMSS